MLVPAFWGPAADGPGTGSSGSTEDIELIRYNQFRIRYNMFNSNFIRNKTVTYNL